MAINAKNSKDEVVKGKALFTGLANVKIIAVNPSVDRLEEMFGRRPANEPAYLRESDEGTKTIRVDFFIENTENNLKTKIAFFIEDKVRLSRDGNKTEFINEYGKSTFATSIEDTPSWFKKEGAREALIGESKLHNFIKAWANVPANEDCLLESMENLIGGNVSEITEMVNNENLTDNEVRVLLGVRDGMYQGVYDKYFGRPYIKSTTGWEKALSGEYGAFINHDWNNSFEFKPFKPAMQETPDPERDPKEDW